MKLSKSVQVDWKPTPPNIIIYGTPGVGKTTFATSGNNVIAIITEDGLGKRKIHHFPKAAAFQEVIDYLEMLINEEHDYEAVVIDSLDWLESLIWQQVAADHGKSCIEDIGYGKGYIYALVYWQKILILLDVLRNEKLMMPIMTAHAQVKSYNNPQTDPYDRYVMKLHDKARAKVEEWSDIILFATYKVATKRVETKNGSITRGIGTGERVMFTSEQPGFVAKNRYSLPHEMPLDFNALLSAITASMDAE